MKVEVRVSLRRDVLDPQGKAIEHAIERLGFKGISNARVGRVVAFDIDAKSKADAQKAVEAICDKLLVNPIIEDYSIEWPEA